MRHHYYIHCQSELDTIFDVSRTIFVLKKKQVSTIRLASHAALATDATFPDHAIHGSSATSATNGMHGTNATYATYAADVSVATVSADSAYA